MTGFNAQAPLLADLLCLHSKWLKDKPAFYHGQAVVTWRGFTDAVCRVANGLLAGGIARGDRVALVMSPDTAAAESLFGILMAGGVAAPLDPQASGKDLLERIGALKPRVLIASADQCPRLETMRDRLEGLGITSFISTRTTGGEREIVLPAGWLAYGLWKNAQGSGFPGIAVEGTDPCTILYTAGTAGAARGVVHNHRARADWAGYLAPALEYRPLSVTLWQGGVHTQLGLSSLLCSLSLGASTVVLERFEPGAWLDLVEARGVNHAVLSPFHAQLVLDDPDFMPHRVAGLETLICAEATLFRALRNRITDAFPNPPVEIYALTEGAQTVLYPQDTDRKSGSVGKPVRGTDVKIIDGAGVELGPGVIGEIVVRGPTLMTAYWGDTDRHGHDPWLDPEGRAWLRTGDAGRFDDEGYLQVVDRISDLIVSGGMAISSSGIEGVIASHPGVAEVAVIAVPNDDLGAEPLALVVPRAGVAVTADAILSWANRQFVRPNQITRLELRDILPRNPTGKVMKSILRREFWQA